MLFKNLLLGVGSAGIIGAGGYGIYSVTWSSNEDAKDDKENVNSNNERDSGESTPPAESKSGSEVTQSTDSDNSIGENGGIAGSQTTTDFRSQQALGSEEGPAGENAGGSGGQGTSA